MSITKYFTAEPIKSLMTKSSQYADPAFGIFRISNNIPASQVTTLQNQDKDNLWLSQSQTLPIGLADTEEKEEQNQSKALKVPKKKKVEHSQETVHTL